MSDSQTDANSQMVDQNGTVSDRHGIKIGQTVRPRDTGSKLDSQNNRHGIKTGQTVRPTQAELFADKLEDVLVTVFFSRLMKLTDFHAIIDQNVNNHDIDNDNDNNDENNNNNNKSNNNNNIS